MAIIIIIEIIILNEKWTKNTERQFTVGNVDKREKFNSIIKRKISKQSNNDVNKLKFSNLLL